MTTVLAFDTSQQWLSACIAREGQILAQFNQPMATGQSESLVPTLLKLLEQTNLTTQDISRILTITGPGSFTGLRISLATAQGIGLALSKPVLGVDAFVAYAACVSVDKNILVVIDSQKADVYCQLFSSDHKPIKDAAALNPAELIEYIGDNPFTLTGTGLEKILPLLENEILQFDIVQIKPDQICQNICLINQRNFTAPEPFYLKEAMVTKPNNFK